MQMAKYVSVDVCVKVSTNVSMTVRKYVSAQVFIGEQARKHVSVLACKCGSISM